MAIRILSAFSVFANVSADRDPLALAPCFAALADRLAFLNDDSDNFLEDYAPGWQDDEDSAFEPSPSDWAALRDDRDHDGFLSDDERAMAALTESDWEYRCRLADEAERIAAGAIL